MARPKPPPGTGASGEGEDAAIERLGALVRHRSGPVPPGEIWTGDDSAVVARPPGPLVLATDAAVAGVHADLTLVSLADLGWKALAATVSDVGAMGARPLHALATYCVPPGTGPDELDALAAGVVEASAEWRCPVVGGDLSAAGQVVVSIAVTGTLDGDRPPVRRSGASPGDQLLVTGPLGGSAAGLRLLRAGVVGSASRPGLAAAAGGRAVAAASFPPDLPGGRAGALTGRAGVPTDRAGTLVAAHRRPRARVAEGREARVAGATALIDVSDGLAVDLHRLADASGVGFELALVPVAGGATREEALAGGEDYELVVATPDPDGLTAAFAAAGLRPPVAIGQCCADRTRRVLDGEPLPRLGWQHPIG